MQQLQALYEKRNGIGERMTAQSQKYTGASWDATQQQIWDRDLAELEAIDQEIRRVQSLHERMRVEGSSARAPASRDADVWTTPEGRRIRVLGPKDRFADLPDNGPAPRFGFGDFVRAMVLGTNNPDIRASLSEGTDSAGGYTVPTSLLAQVIDRMRARQVCVRAGARTVPLETLKTNIVRLATDPVPSWRNENAAIAEGDPTFEQVQFVARHLAVMVKVSRELLEDSLNLDSALSGAFAGSLAVELDRVCLTGTGTPPEPRGIFNTSGIGSVSMGTNGAQFTSWAKLLDTLYELSLANADTPTAAVMHPRTKRTIDGLADTTNQPLMRPKSIEELPFLETTSLPITQTQGTANDASPIIVGNFEELWIGVRRELRIEVLRERYAENHQYAFIAHLRADTAVAHAGSFAKLIGIIP